MKKKLLGILVTILLLCSTALADLAPKYTQALDAFLVKLETYQNNSNYVQILERFVAQLTELGTRYSSSGNVPLMIDYLVSGVNDLKAKKLAADIDDEFIEGVNKIINNTSTGTTSSQGEVINCSDGYTLNGTTCVAKTKTITSATYNSRTYTFTSFILTYGTPQTKTSSSLAITGGTSTLTTTFTLGTDGTTITLSGQSENVSCNSGYSKSGNNCVVNSVSCSAQSLVNYSVPALSHLGTSSPTRSTSITGGTIYYQRTFTCNNGSLSYGDESVSSVSCNSGYTASGNSCMAKTKIITSATYNSRTYTFTSFTLTYGTSQTKTSSSLAITGGTSTLTTTFTLGTDGTAVTLSGQSENVSCNSGYSKSGNNCVANPVGCSAQSLVNYSVPALNHGEGGTMMRSVSITGGAIFYQRTFTCNNGALSYGSESVNYVSCNSSYTRSGDSCVANSTVYPGIQGTTSGAYCNGYYRKGSGGINYKWSETRYGYVSNPSYNGSTYTFSYGSLSDYPAFAFCIGLGTGRRLPTHNEILSLNAQSCVSSVASLINDSYRQSRPVWSSTERSDKNGVEVSYGNTSTAQTALKKNFRPVICIHQ